MAELLLLTAALLPWMNATASDGPQDGRTWSWDVLGLPVAPGAAGLLIWLASIAVVCGGTWSLISVRILRRLEQSTT